MAGLNESQSKELKECFNLFDTDKSGYISSGELSKVLKSLEIKVSDAELDQLMKHMDRDGSGQIDFKEFVAVMAQSFYRKPTKKELEEAFRYFDTDSSNFITETELLQVLKRFKSGISIEEAKKKLQSMDKNSDGKISIEEFIAIMS